MARPFAKVSEEEIEELSVFYPSDLVNAKTTIPLRVCEELWIYIPQCFVSRYISTTIHLPFSELLYIIVIINSCCLKLMV